MSTQLNNQKPARFGGSSCWATKGKEDGRGNAEATFHMDFSLVDFQGDTIAVEGVLRWNIVYWVPGIGHSDPALDMLYVRQPSTFPVRMDEHKIGDRYDRVLSTKYFRATGKTHKSELWYQIDLKPIKLKIDEFQWHFNYEMWFRPRGILQHELYDGHKSQFWYFNLREMPSKDV